MGEGLVGRHLEKQNPIGGVDAHRFPGLLRPDDGIFGAGGAAVPDGDDKIGGVNNELVALQGSAEVKVTLVVGAEDADGQIVPGGVLGGKAVHAVGAAGNQFGGAFGQNFSDVYLFDGTGTDDGNDHCKSPQKNIITIELISQ